MKYIGIILARLDSKRLPSKALKDICGRPLISYAVQRASHVHSLSDVVIATTTRSVDDALADYGRKAGIPVCRGSTDNVADRCFQCSKIWQADFFVRVNADSPFVDPALIAAGLDMIHKEPLPDLITNLIGRTFPYGISVEIVNVATMGRLVGTLNPEEAEHVTKRFYEAPADFSVYSIASSRPELQRARLVVDTVQDLETFRTIAEQLGPRVLDAGYEEVATLYLSHSGSPSSQQPNAAFLPKRP